MSASDAVNPFVGGGEAGAARARYRDGGQDSGRAAGRPRVAVVGRPNVGKSTLVNRLRGRRRSVVGPSIVGPAPGLTRDRLETEVSWRGRMFVVVDTGGVIEEALGAVETASIGAKVAEGALLAVRDADLILLIADARSGATSDDAALAERLRRLDIPLLLVANKADDQASELNASELWSLGLGEPVPVSALHGRGAGELLDRIVDLLPEVATSRLEDPIPSIAIVGRPNVGKSSLFNRLSGHERAIVHPEPGTTRDPIDTVIEIGGSRYRFVDTAGLRKRTKVEGVEATGAARARLTMSRADVAILMVDASQGATSVDQKIAEAVAQAGVGAVLALNKWDLVEDPEQADVLERSLVDRLHFVSYAPAVRISALTGRGMSKLVRSIDTVLAAREIRVPTARINEVVHEAQQRTPPPRLRNRNVRVLYATQAETAPPTFVLFANGRLATGWLRFLERRLRETFGFTGNPLRLVIRERAREPRRGASHARGS